MKKVAIYARVSKAYKEDDERVTIEAQMSDCEAYCNKHGYIIVNRFVDKDKYRVRGKLVNPSGTKKDRPGYTAMLKAALAGEFDIIIAWKEDRLYRGAYAALPLSEALDEVRNLNVELVMENFDHKMLGIKAAIAKIEIDNIRDRMVMGRRVRIERGEIPGGPIRFGYNKMEKRLVVNPAEADVVKRIYTWYNEGCNNMEIRRRLNAMAVPSRSGNKWSKATIQKILTFEGYASGEYKTTLDGESYTIHCEPIISIGVWEKSREVRRKNTQFRSRTVKEDYLCRGLVTCPCGWLWAAKTVWSKGEHGKHGRYDCTKRQNQPEQVHPDCPGQIGSKKVDIFVWDYILKICENPAAVHEAIDKKIAKLKADMGDIEAEAEQLQKRLDTLAEERQWVIAMARTKKITMADMELQLASMEFQALDLRKKHDDKVAARMIQQQAEDLKRWIDDYLLDVSLGLIVLQIDVIQFSDEEREKLYLELEASRFEEKYNGDSLEALKWAIFEEKRRIVHMMIDKVLILKDENGERIIQPKLAIDITDDFASLVANDQSLDYRPAGLEEQIRLRAQTSSD